MKKQYSEEELIYFQTKKLFEEEWENIKGYVFDSMEAKTETYKSLGRHYDAIFKNDADLSIEEFVKAHPNYYSFTEIAEHRLTGKKRDRKTEKPRPKIDKLAVRLKTGLVAERGLAYSFLASALDPKKKFDLDYKTLWIGDCIAWAITDQYGVLIDKEQKKDFQDGIHDLKAMEEYFQKLQHSNPEQYASMVPSVTLTNSQIREIIGRPELLNADIHEFVQNFVGTTKERISKRKVASDGDSWIEWGEIDNICKVRYIRTGKFSSRNKELEEVCYKFIFDRAASLDFWQSVCMGFFDCRPKSYYRLREGTQNIIRALCWTYVLSRKKSSPSLTPGKNSFISYEARRLSSFPSTA